MMKLMSYQFKKLLKRKTLKMTETKTIFLRLRKTLPNSNKLGIDSKIS